MASEDPLRKDHARSPNANMDDSADDWRQEDIAAQHAETSAYVLNFAFVVIGAAALALIVIAVSSVSSQPTNRNGVEAEKPTPAEVIRFMADLNTRYALIEHELGGRREDAPKGNPVEAYKMMKELPDRFEDVSRKLAEASGDDVAGKHASSSKADKPSMKFRRVSRDEVLAMATNAQNEFDAVHAALGVETSSKATDRSQAPLTGLPSLGPVDVGNLNEQERARLLADATRKTARLYQKWLPIKDIAGTRLTAVESTKTALQFSYRIRKQADDNYGVFAERLQHRLCAQSGSDAILQLGGRYEYKLHERKFLLANKELVGHFAIDASSCAR